MTTRKMILTIAAMSATALSAVASAQVINPDNDSATYFRYQPSAASTARQSPAALPSVGQVSEDGRYVYSGSDRGWVNRQHAYTVQGGTLTHMSDCLPYNLPAPVAALVLPARTGPFADHGA